MSKIGFQFGFVQTIRICPKPFGWICPKPFGWICPKQFGWICPKQFGFVQNNLVYLEPIEGPGILLLPVCIVVILETKVYGLFLYYVIIILDFF